MDDLVNPISRRNNIVVQELRGETLIYDLRTNEAYGLNKTSALVWRLCDGKKSTSEISDEMGRILKILVSPELVELAVTQFNDAHLLENRELLVDQFAGLSRRQVIRKIGLASLIALPVLSSLVAPHAAMAQSGGFPIGSACAAPGVCTSSNCVSSICCSATSTSSNATGTFVFCNGTPTTCSTSASTFCCSGTATNSPGFSFCGPAETECTCD